MRLPRFSIRCLFMGHDDLIRRECGRIYLECCDCGRTTGGWTLAGGGRRAFHHPSNARRAAPQFAAAA